MMKIEDYVIVHKEAETLEKLLNEWRIHYDLDFKLITFDTTTLQFIAVIHRKPKTN